MIDGQVCRQVDTEERIYHDVCIFYIHQMLIFHNGSYKASIVHKGEISFQLRAGELWRPNGLWSLNFNLQKGITSSKIPSPSHMANEVSSSRHGAVSYKWFHCNQLKERISLFKLEVTRSMQTHTFFFLFSMCIARSNFQILMFFSLHIFSFLPSTFTPNFLPPMSISQHKAIQRYGLKLMFWVFFFPLAKA